MVTRGIDRRDTGERSMMIIEPNALALVVTLCRVISNKSHPHPHPPSSFHSTRLFPHVFVSLSPLALICVPRSPFCPPSSRLHARYTPSFGLVAHTSFSTLSPFSFFALACLMVLGPLWRALHRISSARLPERACRLRNACGCITCCVPSKVALRSICDFRMR